jgi:hypothetical protein
MVVVILSKQFVENADIPLVDFLIKRRTNALFSSGDPMMSVLPGSLSCL